jgi:hypothetical protein
MVSMEWSYGITTCPARLYDLFPQTLQSLKLAGFDKPRIFIDGLQQVPQANVGNCLAGLEITIRYPEVRTAAHWILSLYELYLRNPWANFYAIFQDDIIAYRNLRPFLEHTVYPKDGYLNLYTFFMNQEMAQSEGWFPSNQLGKGAQALVFDQTSIRALLSSRYMVDRPQDKKRGWRSVDGGICSAMKLAKIKEYCHSPSLVQHVGMISSMGNNMRHQAPEFRGENFDAMDLLGKGRPPT